jgi:hypothetical protein
VLELGKQLFQVRDSTEPTASALAVLLKSQQAALERQERTDLAKRMSEQELL